MRKIINKLKEEVGFTLIEMSIVLLIIAALLLIVIPKIGNVEKSVDETSANAIVQTVESQKILYRIENNMNANDKVDLEKLKQENYITQKQYDIYLSKKK